MRSPRPRSLALVLSSAFALNAFAQTPVRSVSDGGVARTDDPNGGTRLLRTPTVSASNIAFAYAGNIWIVDRAGGDARRLTSFAGEASNPQLSPDGALVAFSGQYAGNTDVYVVAARGGEIGRASCRERV